MVLAILLLPTLINSGCQKKTETKVIDDDIYYTDIIPDTTATSIAYLYLGRFPQPNDSIASIYLDINDDKEMDVELFVYTSFQEVPGSNPDADYSYGSGIFMLKAGDSVAGIKPPYPLTIARSFKSDSLITNNSQYFESVRTYQTISAGNPFSCFTFDGDTYYGIKIKNGEGCNYGWLLMAFGKGTNTLAIKAFAINKALNKPIRAGQIK